MNKETFIHAVQLFFGIPFCVQFAEAHELQGPIGKSNRDRVNLDSGTIPRLEPERFRVDVRMN